MSHHKILGARSVTGIKFNNQVSPEKKRISPNCDLATAISAPQQYKKGKIGKMKLHLPRFNKIPRQAHYTK